MYDRPSTNTYQSADTSFFTRECHQGVDNDFTHVVFRIMQCTNIKMIEIIKFSVLFVSFTQKFGFYDKKT